MATILLVGSDAALLEGLAQSLIALGHEAIGTGSFTDAVEIATAHPPIAAVCERDMAAMSPEVIRLPVAAGGALILYHPVGEMPGEFPLPLGLQRLILADLTLPLERHRLIALIHSVEERAKTVGRGRAADESDGDALHVQ